MVPHCTDHMLLGLRWPPGCLRASALVSHGSHAAANTACDACQRDPASDASGVCAETGSLGREVGIARCFPQRLPHFTFPPVSARGSLFSTSSPHLLVLVLWMMALLTRVRWYLVHFGCSSLVTRDEEHFSRACWPLVHLLIRVLGPFSSRIVVLLSFRGSLCIQDPHPLSDT